MRTISLLLMMFLIASTFIVAAPKDVSDDAIYDQVRLKLAGDRDVGGGAITVKVDKGVVELIGVVKSENIRVKAEKLAKKVKGVQGVVNSLKVATANPN